MIWSRPAQQLTKKQHYDACIETWNYVAEADGGFKWDAPSVKKYQPIQDCFACELYLTDKSPCVDCPFVTYGFNFKKFFKNQQKCACQNYGPYKRYINSTSSVTRKREAIKIAQLFIDTYPE